MKRIIYLTLILPIFIISCESSPDAAFYIDNTVPEVGQEVLFTNSSANAERFEWDFGDNTFTEEPNPSHVYTGTGTFQVTLTAWSKSGIQAKAYATIDVRIPTLLEVEVIEYTELYPVENASVILYPTIGDWDAETNEITEGFTDADGIVVFSHLGNSVFYLDIWEAHHNNYTLRDDDVNFIRIPQIKLNSINRFTAYVDYVPGTKGDGTRDRKMVIKKIVPRIYIK
jgi:hypothetical protein